MGITTVAVTTFSNSNICKTADYTLLTQTRESPLHKIAITSRVSQFAMMDSLFMAYLTINYDKCINNLEKTHEISDALKDQEALETIRKAKEYMPRNSKIKKLEEKLIK